MPLRSLRSSGPEPDSAASYSAGARSGSAAHFVLEAAAAAALMIGSSIYPMHWYVRATFLTGGAVIGIFELLRHDGWLDGVDVRREGFASQKGPAIRSLAAKALLLIAGCEIAGYTLWYLWTDAFAYVHFDAATFGPLWPYRVWAVAHIVGGTAALVSGPWQLWSGARRKGLRLHRKLGWIYVLAVLVTSGVSFRLAFVIGPGEGGMRAGVSMMALGAAWLLTTGMGVRSIVHGHVVLHREWMIRSYILALAFGTLRWLADLPIIERLGSQSEIAPLVIWASWTVPLLIAEAVFQWRKTGRLEERAASPG